MNGRNERFVRTAKTMLLFQVGAAAVATALGGWAVVQVRDVLRERDALAARVAQLESPAPPQLLPPPPADALETGLTPPPGEAEPPITREPVLNTIGGARAKAPPPPPPPGPATVACTRLHDRSPSRCPLPVTYFNGYCRDVQNLPAICPGGPPAPPAPAPPTPSPPAPPTPQSPSPPRDCQSVQRQPIVCVPPFRRTPVPGVCVDGNNRPMRCPRGTPREERPRQDQPQPNDPRQQPTTRALR